MPFHIQIQRGDREVLWWWETVQSLAIPRNGFATEEEAWAYVYRNMRHVKVNVRVLQQDDHLP